MALSSFARRSPVSDGAPVVLVVDDSDWVRRWVGLRLAQMGYEVLEARTVEQAAAQAAATRLDLVVSDLGVDLGVPSVAVEPFRAMNTKMPAKGLQVALLLSIPLDALLAYLIWLAT